MTAYLRRDWGPLIADIWSAVNVAHVTLCDFSSRGIRVSSSFGSTGGLRFLPTN